MRIRPHTVPTWCCIFLLIGSCLDGQEKEKSFAYDRGGIIRGERAQKELALVFTGDSFADGGEHIRQTLARHHVKGSFFLTGNFYRNADFRQLIKNLTAEGHYLGAHSDAHLLYCAWENRDSLLVTREEFEADLAANYREMERFGISKARAKYFLPPYEWYNEKISAWAKAWGLTLVNFTPGTRSHADYTYPEMAARYLSSERIMESIWAYELFRSKSSKTFISNVDKLGDGEAILTQLPVSAASERWIAPASFWTPPRVDSHGLGATLFVYNAGGPK